MDNSFSYEFSVNKMIFRDWMKVVLQGRGDILDGQYTYWVTVFHIEYSINGYDWIKYG